MKDLLTKSLTRGEAMQLQKYAAALVAQIELLEAEIVRLQRAA